MLVLINCNYDGDTFAIFNDLETAMPAFKESCENAFNHKVYLVKPKLNEDFGFSRGDVFGAEIIEEHEAGDEN